AGRCADCALNSSVHGGGKNSWGNDWLASAARDDLGAGLCLHTSICYRGIPTRVRKASVGHGGLKELNAGTNPPLRGGGGDERRALASRKKTPRLVPRQRPDSITKP